MADTWRRKTMSDVRVYLLVFIAGMLFATGIFYVASELTDHIKDEWDRIDSENKTFEYSDMVISPSYENKVYELQKENERLKYLVADNRTPYEVYKDMREGKETFRSCGFYDPKNKIIVAQARKNCDLESVLLHEYGHYVWYEELSDFERDEWTKRYEDTKYEELPTFRNYTYTNEREFYADYYQFNAEIGFGYPVGMFAEQIRGEKE
jgi:hypothetical protein